MESHCCVLGGIAFNSFLPLELLRLQAQSGNLLIYCWALYVRECVCYPVTLRQQLHAGSRQDCQQLLEGHEGFLEVKGQLQLWYVPDVRQEGGVVVGVVPEEKHTHYLKVLLITFLCRQIINILYFK